MIPDLGLDEPLEDGLPDPEMAVEDFTGVPMMGEVPVPRGFLPDDELDLADVPVDPLD